MSQCDDYEEKTELDSAIETVDNLISMFGRKLFVYNSTDVLELIDIDIVIEYLESKGFRLYHQINRR